MCFVFSSTPSLSSQICGTFLNPTKGEQAYSIPLTGNPGIGPRYHTVSARQVKLRIELIPPCLLGRRSRDAMGVGRSVHTCSEVALRRGLGCRVTFCEGCWITWVPLYLPVRKGHDLVRMGRIQLGTECISKSWRNT